MENNDNIIVDLEHEKDDLEESFKKRYSVSGGHHHSEHHHSSHHGHHSSKRRGHSSKNEKYKRFFKRYKYRIANIGIALLFVCILVVVGVSLDKRNYNSEQSSISVAESGEYNDLISSMQIEIPIFDEDVVVVGTAVTSYMDSDSVDATSIYKKFASYGRLDTGLPVKLSFNVKGMPDGYSVRSTEIFVSENSDMSSPQVFSLASGETSVEIYHLKTNTQYYYRISLSLSNASKTSVEGSFKTADTPRVLSVDGVHNLRDIGGWKTSDGRRIMQGLLYRSTEIDGAVNPDFSITPDGVNTMLSVFGIKTDMDLRYSSENPDGTNALGAGVKHIYYGAPLYSNAFTDEGKKAIRNVFADLADKNNYPVLLHCTHGMDRTGTVCYLLEAVLGVSEEDMMRDYQLSALYHGSLWALDQMNEFIGRLKSYDGLTIQNKAESFLISIGVTEEEIENIRDIFLD